MKKISLFLVLGLLIFCCGCNVIGWIIAPGPYDRKVPAEFEIKNHTDENVMVIVDQIAGSDSGIFMRQKLSDIIGTMLVTRAGVKKKYLFVQSEVETMRKSDGDYLNYSPIKVAVQAGVGLVVYTRILDYKLYPSGPKGYYIGSLDTGSVIIDVEQEKVVWPADGNPRVVRMEVGIESKGKNETLEKLLSSTAHGIVRHLYDIRVLHFKTSLEKVSY